MLYTNSQYINSLNKGKTIGKNKNIFTQGFTVTFIVLIISFIAFQFIGNYAFLIVLIPPVLKIAEGANFIASFIINNIVGIIVFGILSFAIFSLGYSYYSQQKYQQDMRERQNTSGNKNSVNFDMR